MLNNDQAYRKMLENFYEGVYYVDTERRITFWNKGAERITGFLAQEVLGSYCYDNILNHVDEKGTQLCLGGCPLEQTIQDGVMREASVYLHHKDGYRVPVDVRAIALTEDDIIMGAVEVFSDSSVKQQLIKDMENLKVLAMKDQLTGLGNRRYTEAVLESKIKEFTALGIPLGLAFLDIDRFKSVNDTYGHDRGDEVLKMVAQTSSGVIRSSDVLGRWGGEEFLGIFPGVDKEGLKTLTEKIRMLVERSALRMGNKTLSVTISIGATMVTPQDTVEEALKRADSLLYRSKRDGRNRVTLD